MTLHELYLDEDHADRLKRIRRSNEYLRTFYDKIVRVLFSPRMPSDFRDEQIGILLRTPELLAPVMIDEHRRVKSNFALAEIARYLPLRRYYKVKFSKMTEAQVRAFVRDLKVVAKRNKWPREMLDIELQFLGDYR